MFQQRRQIVACNAQMLMKRLHFCGRSDPEDIHEVSITLGKYAAHIGQRILQLRSPGLQIMRKHTGLAGTPSDELEMSVVFVELIVAIYDEVQIFARLQAFVCVPCKALNEVFQCRNLDFRFSETMPFKVFLVCS